MSQSGQMNIIVAVILGIVIGAAVGYFVCGSSSSGSAPGEGPLGRFRLLNLDKEQPIKQVGLHVELPDPVNEGQFVWQVLTPSLIEEKWAAPFKPLQMQRFYYGHVGNLMNAVHGVKVTWKQAGIDNEVQLDHTDLDGLAHQVRCAILVVNDDMKGRLLLQLWDTKEVHSKSQP